MIDVVRPTTVYCTGTSTQTQYRYGCTALRVQPGTGTSTVRVYNSMVPVPEYSGLYNPAPDKTTLPASRQYYTSNIPSEPTRNAGVWVIWIYI